MQNETKGMVLGLVGVCAFGLTLPATRIVVAYADPVFIGLGRAALAAVFALMLLLWFGEKIPSVRQAMQLAVVALGVVIGFPFLASWAMLHVPASHGGVVVGILPMATAVVGVLVSAERPSIGFWVVSCIGSGLVMAYALYQGAGQIHIADLALLGAVLCAAVGYALGAKVSQEIGGWQVICWALVLAFPFVLVPALQSVPDSLADIPVQAYLSFGYLVLVSQLLAFFVWYKGLALGGIARVSQAQLLQPFVTLIASVLILGEALDASTVIFIFLVVCSVWVGKKMPIQRLQEADAQ
ncbi:MAG: EamA family transporter [Gammaproteobacteria bacterium]|nr:MAG: EamA family transporter [Gammaproteobacteria bacterium]